MESWQNTIMAQEHNSRNSAISEFQGTFLRNNFHRFPVSDIELMTYKQQSVGNRLEDFIGSQDQYKGNISF